MQEIRGEKFTHLKDEILCGDGLLGLYEMDAGHCTDTACMHAYMRISTLKIKFLSKESHADAEPLNLVGLFAAFRVYVEVKEGTYTSAEPQTKATTAWLRAAAPRQPCKQRSTLKPKPSTLNPRVSHCFWGRLVAG